MTDKEHPLCAKCGSGILMPITDYAGEVIRRCTLCGWSYKELPIKSSSSKENNV